MVQHESNITNVNSLFIPTVTRFLYKCLRHDTLFYHSYSLLAAPHPFIAGTPLAGRHFAALSERQASAILPLPAPHSPYLCRTGTATDDTSHIPFVSSSFDNPTSQRTCPVGQHIVYSRFHSRGWTVRFHAPMFFSASCRNEPWPCAGRRASLFCSPDPPRLFHPAFSAIVFSRSHHHYSVAKLVCRRDRFLEP